MIALRLVRLIERHSDELAAELTAKLETSSRTSELRKVPVDELRRQIQELLRHFGEWLLTKTSHDIEQRYFEIGERRASQGVALSDFCWAIVLTKEHLWEFLQRQGFMNSPVELYGEMELLRLLDQFFDRALCYSGPVQELFLQEPSPLFSHVVRCPIFRRTIVDATLIHAPSSTKNREQSRDPEMHQAKKGKNWYFGMKAQVGVDSKTKIIHTAVATAANVSDVAMLPDLLHGEETRVSWMQWRGRRTGRSRRCGRGWSTCFR